MAKISQLPTETDPTLTDSVPTLDVEGSSTKKTTLQKILDLFKTGYIPYLRNIQIYDANDTWNKPSGMANSGFVIVMVQGGGGGGGGAGATNGSQMSAGSGGGAGVFAWKKVAAATLGSSETVTIGAAGAANSGAAGGNGGNSSFGTHCTANGGTGGTIETASNASGRFVPAAAGVSTGTGDVVVPGDPGHAGMYDPGNNNVALGGHGAMSRFGAGGENNEANAAGKIALGAGSGGGGGALTTSQSAVAGGAGVKGKVLVYEYY